VNGIIILNVFGLSQTVTESTHTARRKSTRSSSELRHVGRCELAIKRLPVYLYLLLVTVAFQIELYQFGIVTWLCSLCWNS